MSSAKICIDEALKALNVVLKSEKDSFYKDRVKSVINTLNSAQGQIKLYEKVKNYPDTVVVLENGIPRRAKKEEIFKMVRREQDINNL